MAKTLRLGSRFDAVARRLTILDPIGEECERALRFEQWTDDGAALELRARALLGAAKSCALEEIAKAAGLTIVNGVELPGGEFAILLPLSRKILVRRGLKPAQRLAAIAHEIAHWILGSAASHAAVWYFALVLLFPPEHVRAVRVEDAPVIQVMRGDGRAPKWAAVLMADILSATWLED